MFRKEAIAAKTQKLQGDVFLTQPVSFLLLGILLFLIVFSTIVLLCTGSYARSEQVKGYLVPSKGLVKIHASKSGTLNSIEAREGEIVKAGQKLASILVSTNALDGISFVDKTLTALFRQETEIDTQIFLEHNQLESETARLRSEQAILALEIRAFDKQLSFQKQLVASIEESIKGIQRLLSQGYLSKEESKRHRQEWLKQKTQEKLLEQEFNKAVSKGKLLALRLLQLPDESKRRIARLKIQKAELDERKNHLLEQDAYAITAPVNGKVLSISTQSIGRSVHSGQQLLTIMPEHSVLKAELFLPAKAIGFIEKGQEVRLLYDAFPYQFFGSHKATITFVTETLLAPAEILAPFQLSEPVYRVSAAVESATINISERKIKLQSGMTLKANIILERRSFLDWILTPLRAVRART